MLNKSVYNFVGYNPITVLSSDLNVVYGKTALPGGCAVHSVSLRPIACWQCGFESRRGAWISLVSVLWCQIEISASG